MYLGQLDMHINRVMCRHSVLLLALFAITLNACGCSGQPANPRSNEKSDQLLEFLDGTRFVSTEKYEVGLGETGPEMGYWYLSFQKSTVTWDFSDTRWSGTFAIAADGTITANMGSQQLTGVFNPLTRILDWDNKQYQLVEDSQAGSS